MTGAMSLLYLGNLVFVFLSWKWATEAFEIGNKWGGYFNLFASALNAAIIVHYFFKD